MGTKPAQHCGAETSQPAHKIYQKETEMKQKQLYGKTMQIVWRGIEDKQNARSV